MKKVLFLALSCSLWACKDDEVKPVVPPPPTEQQPTASVTVWDATQWSPDKPKGVLSEGATVSLYKTRQDFLASKPAYTATTNSQGVASFKDIPEGEYFMVANKGGLTNTWRDAQGMTRVSDSLFQTEAEIKDPTQPIQTYALPGDFRYRDLNGDGIINNNDVAEAPFFTLTVKKDAVNTTRAIIGSNVNHAYGTIAAIETALQNEYPKISTAHQQIVMLDGILSDDADCQIPNLPSGWCDFDKFTHTAANNIVDSIWKNHYTSILHLNRMLASTNGIQGDKAAIVAEIKGFRAYLYLELYTYFGGLPITDLLLMPTSITRTPANQTLSFIKKELADAAPSLPETAPSGKTWYMTAAAAKMLLARIALLEVNGQDAVSNTAAIISDKKYTLADSAKVFTPNSEIIWDITASMNSPFKDYFVRGNLTVNFCPAIRYTETYLLNAMGWIIQNRISEANESINIVRTRGEKLPITLANRDEALNEIETLYKEELYREGFRFARLVFYNKAAAVLGTKGYEDKNALLPIPNSVMADYPNITQNMGF